MNVIIFYSCLCLSINKKCLHFSIFQCEISETSPGDGLDNDCDGKFDEEIQDGLDNDNDGKTDEDLQLVIVILLYKCISLSHSPE